MATLRSEKEIIYIKHYKIDIIRFNTKSGLLQMIRGCSPTSNRQIDNFIQVFNPKNIVNLNDNYRLYPKNSFSESLGI